MQILAICLSPCKVCKIHTGHDIKTENNKASIPESTRSSERDGRSDFTDSLDL